MSSRTNLFFESDYDQNIQQAQQRSNQKNVSQDEIKQFIQLIQKTFVNSTPQHIVLATCKFLGLHPHKDINCCMNNIKQPSFRNYPQIAQQRYPQHEYPHNLYHPQYQFNNNFRFQSQPQLIDRQPKRREKPLKTYQLQRIKQRLQANFKFLQPKRQWTKKQKQREFAQILLEQGYGIGIAKKKANFQFQLNFYYNSLRSILYHSFKKVQQKVSTQCKVLIMKDEQHKSIKFKTELCSFQKWLNQDQSQTFKEYIKSVYNLNPQPVSKDKTLRLYNNILQRWQKRKNSVVRYKETTQKDTQS